jgi:hypothetical protein
MCTVTYVPGRDQVVLTSNRDEKAVRAKALSPEFYGELLYPKDAEKGGTWIAVHKNGNASVLLNGAFVKHIAEPKHNKSRGIVLLNVMEAEYPVSQFEKEELTNTEPFTLVIWQGRKLYECIWDGSTRHTRMPDMQQPHIWSSVTLYGAEVVERRRGWFYEWLQNKKKPTPDEIIHFHLFGGQADAHNGFRMNRDGKMLTVSITQVICGQHSASVHYFDLADESSSEKTIHFTPA